MMFSTSALLMKDFVSSAQHELFHALGRFHEHSRQDRDRHIIMQWANILPGIGDQVFEMGAIKCTCITVFLTTPVSSISLCIVYSAQDLEIMQHINKDNCRISLNRNCALNSNRPINCTRKCTIHMPIRI